MQYLKCLYLIFLIMGIILCFVKPIINENKLKGYNKIISNIMAWMLGGLWLLLLLKFFGIKI